MTPVTALLSTMPPRPWTVLPLNDVAALIKDANGKQVSVVLAPDFAELVVALVNSYEERMTARMFDSYPMAVVTSADGFTTSVEVDRGEIVNASRLDGLLRPLKVWIWNKRDDGHKGCEPVLQVVYKLP